jgi:hypothetical protein
MTQAPVILEFDKRRKLKCKHKYIRDAVRTSGKSVVELLNDPFGGWPFLLSALLMPGADVNEGIGIDKASDLIDIFVEKHGSMKPLSDGLVQALSAYLRIELTPTDDEKDEEGNLPNADSPVMPGPSTD